VSVAIALSFFLPGSQRGDATHAPLRSEDERLISEEVLASIKLRLAEIDAPKSTRDAKLVRVTQEPFRVSPRSSMLCRSPFPSDNPLGPHEGHWIQVYVTPSGYDIIMSGKGVYPQGTVILKQKSRDGAGTKTVLFTGMLKREKGYNAEIGDWQFFVLDSDATTVTTGNTRSCVQCHAPFHDTDFVSRSYVTSKAVAAR
jgi:hypothetical protein